MAAKIYGDVTRELWELFGRYAGALGVLSCDQTRDALNEVSIFPTKSQVSELVHCACDCAGRAPADHITFAEFCILVTELREQYRKNCPHRQPVSLDRDRAVRQQRKRYSRRLCPETGEDAHFKVFLGGSCNPTTWRQDVVIPFLKEHDITFYNPQVLDWRPELMELEDQAKQTAELLFFVIDNQTRSTASMVEAAYLAGCGRQLVLIIRDFEHPVVVANETLSELEVEDLMRSHAYLTDLVERQGIPVFSSIDTALQCTAKLVKANKRVNELTVDDGVKPVRCPHVRVADRFMKLKDAFYTIDTDCSGKLSYRDMCLAFRAVTNDDLPPLPPASAAHAHTADRRYTFEDFCLIVAEFKYRRKSLWRRLMCAFMKYPLRTFDWLRGETTSPALTSRDYGETVTRRRDVFLGGTCGASTWREDVAMPAFRKAGLSFYNPQLSEWSTRYIPLEAAVKDSCRLLLYVITDDTRGVTSMLEVGHYIGQGCSIVLCLQQLPSTTVIEGEQLTDYAVKDYNRARAYLCDLANRDEVPVFDDVSEAVECAVRTLEGYGRHR